jgi:uncharacterized protein (DUF1778 family)
MQDKKRRVFYCEHDLYKRVKIAAATEGVKLSDFIVSALRKYLETAEQ